MTATIPLLLISDYGPVFQAVPLPMEKTNNLNIYFVKLYSIWSTL